MNDARPGDRITTLAITGMILIVPLIYSTDIYAYTLLPKRLVFSLGVLLGAVSWLIVAWKTGETLTSSHSAVFLGVLCCLVTVSLINATNNTVAVAEWSFFMTLAGLFYLGTRARYTAVDQWTTALMFAGALVSIIGILQYHDLAFTRIPSNGHPSSTFGYRNFAAMYLVAVIPTCFFQFCLTDRRLVIILSVLAGGLSTTFLLYTRTRGAWLGTATGLVVASAALLFDPAARAAVRSSLLESGPLKPILAAAALICIALAGPMAPQFTDSGLQRFDEKKTDISTTVTSVLWTSGDRGRLLMWERTLPLLWDHFINGTGPGHWEFTYPRYDQGAMIRPESSPKRPHNDFIWIAAEHGAPSLLVYLGFLVATLLASVRVLHGPENTGRQFAGIAIAVIIGFSVHGFFSFPKEQPQIAAIFFLFAGVGCRRAPGRPIPTLPIAVALSLVAIVGSYFTWRHIAFDRHYLTALIAEDDKQWSDVESAARAGLAVGSYRPHLHVVHGRSLEKLGQPEAARRAYADALQVFPDSWHAHNGSGVILKREGAYQKAMFHYERALEIFPGATSVRTNLGALYRALGNEKQAESEFRIVLRSKPDDPGANNNLGNILRRRGESDSAKVHYERALATEPDLAQANQNLGDILFEKEDYAGSSRYYLRALDSRPDKPEIYWSLARAYEAAAELGLAEQSYRDAIRVDPSFPNAYFSLATMLYGLHRWPETIELFEHFLTIWDDDPKFVTFAQGRIKASNDWIARTSKK
jgi:tetratricopeptide (TPR) repeat protein/O-antigen ligase